MDRANNIINAEFTAPNVSHQPRHRLQELIRQQSDFLRSLNEEKIASEVTHNRNIENLNAEFDDKISEYDGKIATLIRGLERLQEERGKLLDMKIQRHSELSERFKENEAALDKMIGAQKTVLMALET